MVKSRSHGPRRGRRSRHPFASRAEGGVAKWKDNVSRSLKEDAVARRCPQCLREGALRRNRLEGDSGAVLVCRWSDCAWEGTPAERKRHVEEARVRPELKLTRLGIDGYQGLDDVTLEFEPDTTLIVCADPGRRRAIANAIACALASLHYDGPRAHYLVRGDTDGQREATLRAQALMPSGATLRWVRGFNPKTGRSRTRGTAVMRMVERALYTPGGHWPLTARAPLPSDGITPVFARPDIRWDRTEVFARSLDPSRGDGWLLRLLEIHTMQQHAHERHGALDYGVLGPVCDALSTALGADAVTRYDASARQPVITHPDGRPPRRWGLHSPADRRQRTLVAELCARALLLNRGDTGGVVVVDDACAGLDDPSAAWTALRTTLPHVQLIATTAGGSDAPDVPERCRRAI